MRELCMSGTSGRPAAETAGPTRRRRDTIGGHASSGGSGLEPDTDEDKSRRRRIPPPNKLHRETVGFADIRHCRDGSILASASIPLGENENTMSRGRIALCVKHHAMADRGVWSRDQLRAFKYLPHSVQEVKAKFEWSRPKQVLRMEAITLGART